MNLATFSTLVSTNLARRRLSRPWLQGLLACVYQTRLTHSARADRCLDPTSESIASKIITMWCPLTVISDILSKFAIIRLDQTQKRVSYVRDCRSDGSLVMALPVNVIRNLQIACSQKVGLVLLFLIGTIVIIFDITRTVCTVDGGTVAIDTIWDIPSDFEHPSSHDCIGMTRQNTSRWQSDRRKMCLLVSNLLFSLGYVN